MNKIIGGNHGLPEKKMGRISKPLSEITLINARSCFYSILNYLNHPSVWMPSYLCESLLNVAHNVKYYEVDRTLKINESFLDETKPSEVILIIDYFGFKQDKTIYEKIKRKKCISIEDASQSLFSQKHSVADFTIYSLTKCLGLPDGGMIESNDPSFEVETIPPPMDFIEAALTYRKKRAKFDSGEENNWYSDYLNYKEIATPIGPFAMSDLSKSLYMTYDQKNIVEKTRRNYKILQNHINPIKRLEDGVSPIGFPIIHEKRDELLSALIKERIYPPVHWRLKKVPKAFSDSYWVSERQITLPCDQRYDEEDMERIIKCVKTLSS
jgi:dTDP-4-amino-4,6-dideoxygalactose transaminase